MVGVECKRVDAPKLTPSMRTALSDMGLEKITVIYPEKEDMIWLSGLKQYP